MEHWLYLPTSMCPTRAACQRRHHKLPRCRIVWEVLVVLLGQTPHVIDGRTTDCGVAAVTSYPLTTTGAQAWG